jgi:hypothetical protein
MSIFLVHFSGRFFSSLKERKTRVQMYVAAAEQEQLYWGKKEEEEEKAGNFLTS